jgi:hypothetical protein
MKVAVEDVRHNRSWSLPVVASREIVIPKGQIPQAQATGGSERLGMPAISKRDRKVP